MVEYTEGYDVLAGMELGAVPLIVALSLETGIPYVIVRKEKREREFFFMIITKKTGLFYQKITFSIISKFYDFSKD